MFHAWFLNVFLAYSRHWTFTKFFVLGNKTFTCPYCTYAGYFNYYLKMHVAVKHEEFYDYWLNEEWPKLIKRIK